jgi:hypothetical protein
VCRGLQPRCSTSSINVAIQCSTACYLARVARTCTLQYIMYSTCARHAQYMRSACAVRAPYVRNTCTVHAQCASSTRRVHYAHACTQVTAHAQYYHAYQYSICTVHVQYMHIARALRLHNMHHAFTVHVQCTCMGLPASSQTEPIHDQRPGGHVPRLP